MFLGAILGGAFFLFLYPILANASFLSSLLQKTAPQSSASAEPRNSQTVPLLAPATNIDPTPATGGGDITLVGGTALLAQEGPAAGDDTSHPATSQISVYVVRESDTLASIAQMFGVSINTIIWANDIQKNTIRPGQTLIILPITGIKHTIVKSDTLASLAKTYKSDAHDIASYNNLADDAALAVGETVIIPDGEVTPPPAKPKAVAAKVAGKSGAPTARLHDAGGPDIGNYYTAPVHGILTQGLHGFDAVDIGAPQGTSIFAAAAGVVIIARDNGGWNGGYGNYVVIQHNNGTQTLYAHASQVLVSQGQGVAQGETIAKVGRTGEATGMHLHFEVRGAKNPFGKFPLKTSF